MCCETLDFRDVREAEEYRRRLEVAGWRIVGAPGTDTWICVAPTSGEVSIVVRVVP